MIAALMNWIKPQVDMYLKYAIIKLIQAAYDICE